MKFEDKKKMIDIMILHLARYLQDKFRATLSPKGNVKCAAEEILILWYQYLLNFEGKHFLILL